MSEFSQAYRYAPVRNEAPHAINNTMGEKFDKFLLLMWKNWLLQYRRPIQTIIEIVAPLLFTMLLVVIRSLVDPKQKAAVDYPPFCTVPHNNTMLAAICPVANDSIITFAGQKRNLLQNFTLLYSPKDSEIDSVMDYFGFIFNVTGVANKEEMENKYGIETSNTIFAGIQVDNFKNLSDKDISISVRFPGETRIKTDPLADFSWKTNLMYPIFQMPGPRAAERTTGGSPEYYTEGFLALQHLFTMALLLVKQGIYANDSASLFQLGELLQKDSIPVINMRRFPYPEYIHDMLLDTLKSMLGIIVMLSFVYTCINTVKTITSEKEKQLKEAMKIMGLSNWLHWSAWFVKCFVFLFISVVLMIVFLKIRWYSNTDYTVFTYANPFVMLFFMTFYICATITFCFALSVFFSKANTAATVAGLAWFMSYFPYMLIQMKIDELTVGTKLLLSLGSNSAVAFGFQIIIVYEGLGEGIQWNNIFQQATPDDPFTLGHVIIMLILDTLIYLFIALYVEAVFPGQYGVPLPWNFLFTYSFWRGHPRFTGVKDEPISAETEGDFFEKEPKYLNVGVEIKQLKKVFGKKAAVRNLTLNMYENQITVLLGHNGAGKTTTMSMLTGMFPPTSGTATINGYDIRLEMNNVRNSLGLCPQHNIIFDELTVAEHLYFFSRLKGLSKSEVNNETDKYVSLLELEDKRNAQSSTLSGGMKRKLCVGIALCGNSKVVMLDEPTAGMDPSARRALWNLLQKQKSGRTMLLTTHFMDEADLLGDRIAIMAGGELQCCGSSFFLKKKYGAGYSLIMDKSKDCIVARVTQLLRKYISDIEVHTNVGSELSYLLAENQATVFEAMLHELEEKSVQLGIRSYGISLTTLEEVFMKVGADRGQEEKYNEENGFIKANANGEHSVNVSLELPYGNHINLIVNQFRAMFLKKYKSIVRSWVLLLVQILLPTAFLIITIVASRNQNRTGDLPPLPLNLKKFDTPITYMENTDPRNVYFDSYKSVMEDNEILLSNNISRDMFAVTEKLPITVRRRYIVAASFNISDIFDMFPIQVITAWFNNDPYHSPGISLSLVLQAIYRHFYADSNINFVNAPFPYSPETKFEKILKSQTMGFQYAFNLSFGMAFVSSFYLLFVVKENVSKSKHLQFVSGVKVLIFWITSAICDMATYIVTIVALMITFLCFQEHGFTTLNELTCLLVIFLYFGWSFLPMIYIAGYFFDVPSTGYTRMTLVSIFTGPTAFLVVQLLQTPGFDLEDIGRALHWIFLIIPHYSLATGINESQIANAYIKICEEIYQQCEDDGITNRTECLKTKIIRTQSICNNTSDNYFIWRAPGIGRNVVYSLLVGLILFIILLINEYQLFSKVLYFIDQNFFLKHPVDVQNEDSDVREEKMEIRNAPEEELHKNYILALKNVTKYYNKFLAVNGLCLGVNKYECFGLLGVNGAGKTTTFKMMTGDVLMSYGDGWVNGHSIKREIQKVQRVIGYCPQFDALLEDMTARETLVMFALLRGVQHSETDLVAEYLAKEFDFYRHLDKKVNELSGGNKRKLSTSIALIGDPPVLYLDEPTTGMDPATKRYLWNAICKIRDNGKCIILTSHSMEECEALCTRLAIMVNGNFKCIGSTQHLKSKFAEGYTLTIKMKKMENVPGNLVDTQLTESFIEENFSGVQLREKHQELLTYYITDKSISWSKMFGILERGKRSNLNIEDYSIGQSSLEQVFLTFTKHQS